MTEENIENPFEFHFPETDDLKRMDAMRNQFFALYKMIDHFCPPGNYRELAMTSLEASGMWANRAITTRNKGDVRL